MPRQSQHNRRITQTDLWNDVSGKHPSRKLPRSRYNAIQFTNVLQDYLESITPQEWPDSEYQAGFGK